MSTTFTSLAGLAAPVTLSREPDYGEVLAYDSGTLVRYTRGGEVKSFKSHEWHELQTYTYSYTALTKTERDALRTFLKATVGTRVQLSILDSVYQGFIASESVAITTIHDTCDYNLSFEYIIEKDLTSNYYLVTEDNQTLLTENGEELVLEYA